MGAGSRHRSIRAGKLTEYIAVVGQERFGYFILLTQDSETESAIVSWPDMLGCHTEKGKIERGGKPAFAVSQDASPGPQA